MSTFEPVTGVMIKIVIEKSVRKHVLSTPSKLHFCRNYLVESFCPSLTSVVNASFCSGLSAQVVKSAVIFPLLKIPTLDHNELKNVRTISNQPFILKKLRKKML